MFYWSKYRRRTIEAPQVSLADKRKEKSCSFSFIAISKADIVNKDEQERWDVFAKSQGKTIDWLNSHRSNFEDRLCEVLLKLCREKHLIKHKYDWAWVKCSIDSNHVGVPDGINIKSLFAPDFVKLLSDYQVDKIPDSTVLRKYYEYAHGNFPWYYLDCRNDIIEKNRRNGIVNMFVELMKA